MRNDQRDDGWSVSAAFPAESTENLQQCLTRTRTRAWTQAHTYAGRDRTRVAESPSSQPMPVTRSAVVQSVLMAERAADKVILPSHTAFLSLVSTPSLV